MRVQTERIAFRVPEGFSEALTKAARLQRCQPAEYARRLMLDGMKRDGIELPPVTVAEG